MTTNIKRPIMRYHGGKFLLAPWIISHFPKHRVYTECFGGAGSVLLRKERSYAEIYNDLDGEIVNVFKCMRDNGNDLIRLITLTPFSRNEFLETYNIPETLSDMERARRTIFRSFAGFGSGAASCVKTGFRANSNRSGTPPAIDWRNYPESLYAIIKRLQGVVIENRNALDLLKQHDSYETLHYIDPPYMHITRKSVGAYKFEMDQSAHEHLLKLCNELKGFCIISGYDNEIYNELLSGWTKKQCNSFADGARKRIETLWISPNTIINDLFSKPLTNT